MKVWKPYMEYAKNLREVGYEKQSIKEYLHGLRKARKHANIFGIPGAIGGFITFPLPFIAATIGIDYILPPTFTLTDMAPVANEIVEGIQTDPAFAGLTAFSAASLISLIYAITKNMFFDCSYPNPYKLAKTVEANQKHKTTGTIPKNLEEYTLDSI